MNEKENGLLESPLFTDISKEELAEVGKVVQKEVLPAHTIIFRQGDPGDRFYVITSGKVRVFRKSREGVETDLSQLGPGEGFGEMALLTGEPRSATVRTTEPSEMFLLVQKDFDVIFVSYIGQFDMFSAKLISLIKRKPILFDPMCDRPA